MADIGRSTVEHRGSVERHVLDMQLNNWGAWLLSIPPPHAMRSIGASPACRLYVARYSGEHDDGAPPSRSFDVESAQGFDLFIASTLSLQHTFCLLCRYVSCVSSRDAGRALTMQGWPCSHTTYRRWLDDAHDQLTSEIGR